MCKQTTKMLLSCHITSYYLNSSNFQYEIYLDSVLHGNPYDWPRVIKLVMNGGFVEVDEIISLNIYPS